VADKVQAQSLDRIFLSVKGLGLYGSSHVIAACEWATAALLACYATYAAI